MSASIDNVPLVEIGRWLREVGWSWVEGDEYSSDGGVARFGWACRAKIYGVPPGLLIWGVEYPALACWAKISAVPPDYLTRAPDGSAMRKWIGRESGRPSRLPSNLGRANKSAALQKSEVAVKAKRI
jgi:hypothetical protein